MCKVDVLRALLSQRLNAAVDEVVIVFERTIAEYEEELRRTKEENERQRQLLNAVFIPQVVSHETVTHTTENISGITSADVSEDHLPPEQLEWSSRVQPEEPELAHIKAEEENSEPLHIKKERENPFELEFPMNSVHVKSKNAEGLHIILSQNEENRVEPLTSNPTQHLSTEDVNDHTSSHYPEKSTCSLFEGLYQNEDLVAENTQGHTFPCSVCGKRFSHKKNLTPHMRTHTGEKPFICSICGQRFSLKATLTTHLRRHTGEKPFACSVCGRRFSAQGNWITHMRTHTGEKPFCCSVCNKCFSARSAMSSHMKRHTAKLSLAQGLQGKKIPSIAS